MLFNIPAEVNFIISELERNSFEAWLVGGCVRDFLMGITPKDYDICTSAHPYQIASIFEKTIDTAIKHGTVTVLVNSRPFEVTTFRIDSDYGDHRRPDNVVFSSSLIEDLKRRDFTINAIAYHPKKGIVDPYNGQNDITNEIIRTVGDPMERFHEDALRMLRAIRFKARFGFDIHFETEKAIKLLADSIRYISSERILAEINTILLSRHPNAFLQMFELGLVAYIFPLPIPSMPNMRPFPKLKEELSYRWATLLWQMGFCIKADIEKICHKLKMSNALIKEIITVAEILNRPLPGSSYEIRLLMSSTKPHLITDSLDILLIYNFSVQRIKNIKKSIEEIIENKYCTHLSYLAVNGNDLKNIGFIPGKQLGEILEMLFLCVLQKPCINHKDILLAFANSIASKFL